MDNPGSEQVENDDQSSKQGGVGAFSRKFALGALVFWVVVIVGFVVFRYPYILSKLVGGGEDRPLLAISSAEMNNNILNIEFIRSMPDQPAGVFVVGGHLPSNANSSNPQLENTLGTTEVTYNGEKYEILYEESDPAKLNGRGSGLTISWQDNETGRISIDLTGSYAAEEISGGRAFLLIARSSSDFRATGILHN